MCVTVLNPQSNIDQSPRGTKRSRSPDDYKDYLHAGDENGKSYSYLHECARTRLLLEVFVLTCVCTDDSKPRKKGRPSKTPRTSGDFTHDQSGALPTPSSQTSPSLATTPQIKVQPVTAPLLATPTQSSPVSKTTPKTTLKALPTVRDHTSDQLGPGGDEYTPREYDDQGETKVNDMGYLQGGREYKMRTFTLPGRGEKLFMLATECARTLQYRDSYLLFNKNRSLFKIIASPKEKEELVQHEFLPYSYRSRQIALVTARSMFRQFGSRVVKDGRRVRDDYWEAKARKQGFTEEDAAGEKRPGAARAREAAAAEALGNRNLHMYGNIVYASDSNYGNIQPPPMPPGIASTMPQIPLMETYDTRYRDISRPRQEMTGPPYADITRTSTEAEMASQSSHAAEYSKNVNIQGQFRKGIVNDYWNRPHDPPVSTPQQQSAETVNVTQTLQSPHYDNDETSNSAPIPVPQQPTQSTMNPPSFPHPQNPMHSPSRQSSMSSNYSREQFTPNIPNYPRTSSNLSISHSASQIPNYAMNMQAQQSWGQPPPQPSQSPGMSNRMFTPTHTSPHIQQGQIPSPMPSAHSQSPHPHQQQQSMQPPQMFQQGGSGGAPLYGPGAGLRAMNAAGYPGMGIPQASMYQHLGGQAQHYMQQPQGGQPQGQQNWAGAQSWQNFQ